MPASAPVSLPYPYHVVLDALPRILPSLGFELTSQDPANGMFKIRGRGTMMAAGENLTIRLGTNHPSYSVIQVDSGVRLGIMTYARTSSNFDSIINTLTNYLNQYYSQYRAADAPLPPPPAAPPPPPPPVQQPPQQQQPPPANPQQPPPPQPQQ